MLEGRISMSKNMWDERFSSEEYMYGEVANAFIVDKSTFVPQRANVACFAEGEGRNAVFLAKEGHHVTAYDQSIVGLEKTKTLAAKHDVDVQTVAMDLTSERVNEEAYDVAMLVFGHVPKEDQSFLMNNLIRSVKPGGYVMFEVYSEEQLTYNTGGPGVKDALYDPKDILDIIEPYTCLHFYYGEAERHEGLRHTGKCHVIQVVIHV